MPPRMTHAPPRMTPAPPPLMTTARVVMGGGVGVMEGGHASCGARPSSSRTPHHRSHQPNLIIRVLFTEQLFYGLQRLTFNLLPRSGNHLITLRSHHSLKIYNLTLLYQFSNMAHNRPKLQVTLPGNLLDAHALLIHLQRHQARGTGLNHRLSRNANFFLYLTLRYQFHGKIMLLTIGANFTGKNRKVCLELALAYSWNLSKMRQTLRTLLRHSPQSGVRKHHVWCHASLICQLLTQIAQVMKESCGLPIQNRYALVCLVLTCCCAYRSDSYLHLPLPPQNLFGKGIEFEHGTHIGRLAH